MVQVARSQRDAVRSVIGSRAEARKTSAPSCRERRAPRARRPSPRCGPIGPERRVLAHRRKARGSLLRASGDRRVERGGATTEPAVDAKPRLKHHVRGELVERALLACARDRRPGRRNAPDTKVFDRVGIGRRLPLRPISPDVVWWPTLARKQDGADLRRAVLFLRVVPSASHPHMRRRAARMTEPEAKTSAQVDWPAAGNRLTSWAIAHQARMPGGVLKISLASRGPGGEIGRGHGRRTLPLAETPGGGGVGLGDPFLPLP